MVIRDYVAGLLMVCNKTYMSEIIRMSSKGQIVVPQYMREELGWKKSDVILVYTIKDSVFMRKLTDDNLKADLKAIIGDLEEAEKAEANQCEKESIG